MIKSFKGSNSLGHDTCSIKIYKKLCNRLAPHITHFINVIINSAIYPGIVKVSKLMPQIKSEKDPNKIYSFPPINNLQTLDKIVQEYLKIHLDDHICKNDIICNKPSWLTQESWYKYGNSPN